MALGNDEKRKRQDLIEEQERRAGLEQAAQVEAASSAGLLDPRALVVDPCTSQAAGLELEAPDRQPRELNTEELRVEENLMRARSYDAPMCV